MDANHSILIVDDDVTFCSAVADMLETAGGFTSQTTNTIKEAEGVVFGSELEPSALLLDVALPDGDGREFCARLRQHGSTIPVIMITGLDQEEDVVQALDLGADAYIQKPVTSQELIARLRNLLPHASGNGDGETSS